MSGTCRCGAQLMASVTFCVECGASAAARPVLVAAAPSGARQQGIAAPGFGASTAASGLPYPPYAAPSKSRRPGWSSWFSGPWIAAMTSAAAVALLVIVAFLGARASAPTVAATATPVASASPSAAVGSSYSPAPGSSSASSSSSGSTGSSSGYSSSETTSTAAASSDAGNQLTSLLSSDSPEVSTLADQWVPQLSSKQVGMVVRGVTYDDSAILAEHEALRARYPQARLVLSDDWSVFSGSGYWVTVVAEPFASAGAANAWCVEQRIGPNDCFAKKLSHTAGSQDSTKLRS